MKYFVLGSDFPSFVWEVQPPEVVRSENPSKSRAVQQATTPEWGCTLWDTEVFFST